MDDPAALRRLTSLARTVDLGTPSNRFAVLATAVAFVAGTGVGAVTGAGAPLAVGTSSAIGVFLAWAFGRELDPDRPRSARYAAYVGALALVTVGPPQGLPLVALLVAVRLVLRPTGVPPRLPDLVGAVVLAGLAARTGPGVAPAFAVAAALVWDALLPDPGGLRERFTASLAAATALAGAVLTGALADWAAPTWPEAVAFGIAVLALTRMRHERPAAVADATGAPLHAARLTAARVVVGVTVVAAHLISGGVAAAALAPASAALVGTAITRRHLDSRFGRRGATSGRDRPAPAERPED